MVISDRLKRKRECLSDDDAVHAVEVDQIAFLLRELDTIHRVFRLVGLVYDLSDLHPNFDFLGVLALHLLYLRDIIRNLAIVRNCLFLEILVRALLWGQQIRKVDLILVGPRFVLDLVQPQVVGEGVFDQVR